MNLEESMIIKGYISRIVNNDNVRIGGHYFVESISHVTQVRPVKRSEEFWFPTGPTITIGENTNTLGDWEYVEFAEPMYMTNLSRHPVGRVQNPLQDMTKEEILTWIKENINK